jgi:hypothetical protein
MSGRTEGGARNSTAAPCGAFIVAGHAQQPLVIIRLAGEGQADRHADIGHGAHRHGDGRDAEMAPDQIAVGDPGAVAPGKVGGSPVDIGIGRPDIGRGRQHHAIEPVLVQPVVEIQSPCRFQPFETCFQRRDVRQRGDAALRPLDILGQVEAAVVAVGQRARRLREDLGAVDQGQIGQGRVGVGAQEIVPGPDAEIPDFAVGELGRHQSALDHAARAGPVALVVRDQGKIDFDHLGAEPGEIGGRLFPQGEHRSAGFDRPVGVAVAADIHCGHAEPFAVQRAGQV